MHRWVGRLSIIRLNRPPVIDQDQDDDDNGNEDGDDDEDNVDEVAPQRADAAALLDVAVHVRWHPWALTPVCRTRMTTQDNV